MPRLIHGALCLSLILGSAAQAQTADTVSNPKPLFVLRDALIMGAFTGATIALAPLDRHVTHQLQIPARQSNRALKRGATVFRILGQPAGFLTGSGIYLVGLVGNQRRAEDLGLHTVESIVLSGVVVTGVKVLTGRARPRISENDASKFQLLRGLRNEDYRSFPSGHTASAFAFAAAISSETQKWWPNSRWIIGPILYGGAALTGVSRIYNKDHWASDVMAGAAIGTFAGLKIVRYQHSHPDNWLDRKLLRAGVSHVNGGGWVPIMSTVSY